MCRHYRDEQDTFHLNEDPVPEPSGLMALVSGIAGLGGMAVIRRKR